MLSIQVPVIDIDFLKMQTVCGDHKCTVKYVDNSKTYYEVSTDDPLNFFWLGMNFNHKLGLDNIAEELKKQKPWLYT